jgi:hypothetical protein
VTARLLDFIQRAAFRKESVVLQRYPAGSKALAILKRDKLVEYQDDNCTAIRITLAGRNELRRLRELELARGAA